MRIIVEKLVLLTKRLRRWYLRRNHLDIATGDLTDKTTRDNLRRFAKYLRGHVPPGQFTLDFRLLNDMKLFEELDGVLEVETWLQRVPGCEVQDEDFVVFGRGHPSTKRKLFSHFLYINRIFPNKDALVTEWCYEKAWGLIPATPKEVARRIDYMLDRGIPNDFVQKLAFKCDRPKNLTDRQIRRIMRV